MASDDHQFLSQYLKDVHSVLRKTASKVGAEKAWQEHCDNKDTLTKYAKTMEKLATTHWENNCASDASEATSRIDWAANFCYNYFVKETLKKYIEKDQIIAEKINVTLHGQNDFIKPFKIIDVGSCYNPFKRFDYLDVLAIDLCPANSSVYQCDFLNVRIGQNTIIEDSKVVMLQKESFDIVTFCFVLEYIPSSVLRISACEKAYSILKPGGLLIINTPDSKHVGANCKIMKCWRYTLGQIGFNRIKYEKLRHMHCMAFRKSLHKDIASRWAQLHKEPFMEFAINIPQDFQHQLDNTKNEAHDSQTDPTDFQELPFNIDCEESNK